MSTTDLLGMPHARSWITILRGESPLTAGEREKLADFIETIAGDLDAAVHADRCKRAADGGLDLEAMTRELEYLRAATDRLVEEGRAAVLAEREAYGRAIADTVGSVIEIARGMSTDADAEIRGIVRARQALQDLARARSHVAPAAGSISETDRRAR